MSQKVNPIAVRLKFNRRSNSNWFSDYYYSMILYQDINFRKYLNSTNVPNSNKIGFRIAKSVIHHYPKRTLIHLFCLARRHPVRTSLAKATSSSDIQYNCSLDRRFAPSSNNSHDYLINKKTALRLGAYLRESYNSSKYLVNELLRSISQFAAHVHSNKGTNFSRTQRRVVARSGESQSDLTCEAPLRASKRFEEILKLYKASQRPFRAGCLRPLRGLESGNALKTTFGHATRGNFEPLGAQREPSVAAQPLRFEESGAFFERLGSKKAYDVRSTARSVALRRSGPPASSVLRTFRRRRFEESGQLGAQGHCNKSLHKINQLLIESGISSTSIAILQNSSSNLRRPLVLTYYCMFYFFLKKNNHIYDITHRQAEVARSVNTHTKLGTLSVGTRTLACLKSRYFYLSNIQYILSDKTKTFTSLHPIKVSSIFQSASLVAQELACKLEQKKSFRQICRAIFQQVSNCNYIKGIRISCSGRINGAEIAKTECRKYGETSLHVFSDKIDYAQTIASMPYGILGIKVWISYV